MVPVVRAIGGFRSSRGGPTRHLPYRSIADDATTHGAHTGSAMRSRRGNLLRRDQGLHQIAQRGRQPGRRPTATTPDDDLHLDRSSHPAPLAGVRRRGQIAHGHPDRNRRRVGARGRSRRRGPVPLGRSRGTATGTHRGGGRPRAGMRRNGCRQRTHRAQQRKRRDQSSCEDVHAFTFGGEHPGRAVGSATGDNLARCGYRALHHRFRWSWPGGDFGPGRAPRRLINAVCAVHSRNRLRAPPVLVHPVAARNAGSP